MFLQVVPAAVVRPALQERGLGKGPRGERSTWTDA